MNSFKYLEYNKIKNIISEECHSELGNEIALSLSPLDDIVKINYKLDLTNELQNLLKNGFSINFENISNIKNIIFEFKHQVYNFEEFRKIYFNVSAANSILCNEVEKEEFPKFLNIQKKIIKLTGLEKRFWEIFEPEGKVKDTASSELASIRKRKKQMRVHLVSSLNNKMEEFSSQNYIHDKVITQRDGRFVIPIKEGAVSFVNGIVHGRSSSRSSIFIEPQEIVSLNNDLELLGSEEKQEIFRIFEEYTQNIQNSKNEILNNTEIIKELDFYFASARFSNRIKAERPEIINSPYLKLINARHPLLIEKMKDIEDVIPFDLELGKEFKLLLISGPNTGGKTVTLKTVGLLTLMTLSGLPISADPSSSIGIFKNVFADIGDDQSLENSLSTFSSHISNIKEMVGTGDSNSLVLIDEIGAATDPEQGSALAQAILERLTKNNVLGIITTHYTALKIFAEQHEGCMNAAMQFDPEKHIPTYRFKLGLPGNSFAIEVASQLGLGKNLIERARDLTGNQNVELTDLLKKMTEEKMELSRQNYQYQLKTALLNKKISEHQDQIENLEKETKEIKRKSVRDARDFLTTLQKELNEEINNIKKTDKKRKKELLESSLKKITLKNREFGIAEEKLTPEKREPVKNPKVGQLVWIKEIEAEGEIIDISGDSIKIDLNGIFFTTSKENIFKVGQGKKADNYSLTKSFLPGKEIKMELKILGYRFDEALPEVETFLDNAVMNGLQSVRIVHGKGTGALRSKIRKYLRTNKKAVEFYSPPPEAGGDGVTVVKLES
ncbi:MAG: endonuclease MutS2 [Candidatus Cloacimonetes bacterium]|nr:endonuclease MutS2 [Candidatus Cloacimonadota bacterium]